MTHLREAVRRHFHIKHKLFQWSGRQGLAKVRSFTAKDAKDTGAVKLHREGREAVKEGEQLYRKGRQGREENKYIKAMNFRTNDYARSAQLERGLPEI